MNRPRDRAASALLVARALAWALLLAGWVGVTCMAMVFAADSFSALCLVALWLLALGGFSSAVGHSRLERWPLRGLLIAVGAVAALALLLTVEGGGLPTLVPAVLAWAALVALASVTVRARRALMRARPPAPLGAACGGALLAWLALGDPGDLPALAPRLAGLGAVAALALALLQPALPSMAARPACRAGLFDCSLPAPPAGAWRSPAHWPVWLALLVMLPMMCSLPWMIALCRSESLPARAVVGLHFAAMFVPGLWLGRRTGRVVACAPLLALGAFCAAWALWGAAEPGPWLWLVVVLHGAAWGLAWSAQLESSQWRASTSVSPLRAAVFHAGLAVSLGGLLAWAGPRGFLLWHVGIGAAAVFALAVALVLVRRRQPQGIEGMQRNGR